MELSRKLVAQKEELQRTILAKALEQFYSEELILAFMDVG